MCEVVKSNFKELYPAIEKSLKKAAFIGIDCEFSGLLSQAKLKNSLFDSSSDRYLKLKCSIEQFTIFQFGLAIFHYNRDENKYIADVYSFYTFPCSFGLVDNRFLCQASSWEFLGAHNFNFNKVAYEGVPFLNNPQEDMIRRSLGARTMFSNVERTLSYRDEDILQEECSRVAQWLPLAVVGDTMVVEVSDAEHCLKYFLHKEIRTRFKDVWTFSQPDAVQVRKMSGAEMKAVSEAESDRLDAELVDSLLGFSKVFRLLVALKKPIIGHNLLLDLMMLYGLISPCPVQVRKMSGAEMKAALEAEGDRLDAELVDSLLGFSKVFRLLVALKKPIIGHNLLLDLMMLYGLMYKPLPSTYAAFKKQLNILFPSIHDTKFISYEVKNILKKQDSWPSNRLDHLYVYFNTKGKALACYSPTIEVQGADDSSELENIETHVHEAAWDAYMSGYCFIRLAHYLAIRRLGENALPRPLSRVEHISAVAEYRNCLNVIRGSVSHMNIGGEEPPSTRPRHLIISRPDRKPIDIDEVTDMLASHGSVDVKAYSYCSALIATSNMHSARDIVKAFVKNKKYKVVPYSYLRHSSLVNTLLWSGIIFSGTFCVAALVTSALVRK